MWQLSCCLHFLDGLKLLVNLDGTDIFWTKELKWLEPALMIPYGTLKTTMFELEFETVCFVWYIAFYPVDTHRVWD